MHNKNRWYYQTNFTCYFFSYNMLDPTKNLLKIALIIFLWPIYCLFLISFACCWFSLHFITKLLHQVSHYVSLLNRSFVTESLCLITYSLLLLLPVSCIWLLSRSTFSQERLSLHSICFWNKFAVAEVYTNFP